MRKICVISVLFLVVALPLEAAKRPTMAVINFSNNTGGKGLQYLSRSLPESISATLSQMKDIRVVERENLDKLLREKELEMTGILSTREVGQVGRLARADILLMGSYSGNAERLVVTLKAVEVKNGKVLDGRVVKGSLGEIFDMASQAALSMAAVLSGEDIGYLDVSTTPDRADIYIDGIMVGVAPLVKYRVVAGKRELKAVKEGHRDAEKEVSIEPNGRIYWSPILAEKSVYNRSEMGFGVFAYYPLAEELDKGILYSFFLGHTFQQVTLLGEIGYCKFRHDQEVDWVFDTIDVERQYRFVTLLGHIHYNIDLNSSYVLPYVGGFAGWGNITDYKKVKGDWEKADDGETDLLTLGISAGVNIIPFSKIGFFVEARYYFYTEKIDRIEYESNQLAGNYNEEKNKINFHALAIGAGIKYYF